MSRRDLRAAGITDPDLQASYERCRRLNAAHGRTYYLATLLLPPRKRPYVHALYAFARQADEIVDELSSTRGPGARATALRDLRQRFLDDLRRGSSDDPIGRATVDTACRWAIPREHFVAFLDSMAMDLSVREYADFDALRTYTHGSAAVIGLQLVPILEPLTGDAHAYAAELGTAFQLANFVRDVGEDLDRGRLYLPLSDLARFDLTRADLERRQVDDRVRALLQFEIARVRAMAEAARPGIALLAPSSRPCVETARTLYVGITDAVEAIDYQVFSRRATVSVPRRLQVAAPAWLRAVRARRSHRFDHVSWSK